VHCRSANCISDLLYSSSINADRQALRSTAGRAVTSAWRRAAPRILLHSALVCLQQRTKSSGVVGAEIAPLLFNLPENVFVENCFSEIQSLRLKVTHSGKLKDKIKILSTHNFLCLKFAAVSPVEI